ncbi:MAG TPA: TRAP transporter large permease subunit, partial [Bacillota bacterium]
MTWGAELAIFVVALIGLLLMGQWIAFALGTAGLISLYLHDGTRHLPSLGNIGWNSVNDFVLTAVPLFVFMGEVILRSGLSQRFYHGVTRWLGPLPGGLLHSNIVACALFAAISGSSVATAAAIGTVAIPELVERKYERS